MTILSTATRHQHYLLMRKAIEEEKETNLGVSLTSHGFCFLVFHLLNIDLYNMVNFERTYPELFVEAKTPGKVHYWEDWEQRKEALEIAIQKTTE